MGYDFNPRSLAGATQYGDTTLLPDYDFNPRSLAGATCSHKAKAVPASEFQSTLPRGSDPKVTSRLEELGLISIHAPSRERHVGRDHTNDLHQFQSTLPRGSDHKIPLCCSLLPRFQSTLPRGSDLVLILCLLLRKISIHAPSRERQHQNKLLLYSFKSSIFCELAQLKYSKIYFDVRKLIVSHSSLSCEPKLNFMFHITSHRIILHYFYSCQSICK